MQKKEAPVVAAAAPPTQASPAKTKAKTKPASGDGGKLCLHSLPPFFFLISDAKTLGY